MEKEKLAEMQEQAYKKAQEDALRQKIRTAFFNTWQTQERINTALDDGISRGETFGEFQARTGAPAILKADYIKRQQASGIAPHSDRKAKREQTMFNAFLDG